ncbi:MAG TPA: XRE family transcriptional regulator [Kofleriaceae bacterium]|jgi:Zn-dependent peptidase ImmA (M78 family)
MISVIGQAVKRNREALGLSIETLARHADVPEDDLRALEQNGLDTGVSVLSDLARAMGLPSTSFLSSGAATVATSPVVSARFFHEVKAPILSDADVVALARDVTRAEVFSEMVTPRTDLSSFRPREPGPKPWRNGYDLASTLRTRLALGAEPIESVQLVLEDQLGILVTQRAFTDARLRAVAVRGAKGRLVMSSARQSTTHARISLAHELCHHLCDLAPNSALSDEAHGTREPFGMMGSDGEEERAKAFAVMFLAPRGLVRDAFGDPARQFQNPDRARDAATTLAERAGISPIAALWHLFHLEYLTDDETAVAETARYVPAEAAPTAFERSLGGPDGFMRAIEAAQAADELDEDHADRLRRL